MLTSWHSWPVFALFMLLIVCRWSITLCNAYATTIQSIDTRKVFNFQYLFMNVGVVAGTAIVGFLFDYGVQYVFGSAVSCTLYFLFLSLNTLILKGWPNSTSSCSSRKAPSKPTIIYAILGLALPSTCHTCYGKPSLQRI